jgi:hypothetical protein
MKKLLLISIFLACGLLYAQDAERLELAYTYKNCSYGCRLVEYKLSADGRVDYIRKDELPDANDQLTEQISDQFSLQLPAETLVMLAKAVQENNFFALESSYQWLATDAGEQVLSISLGGKKKTVSLKNDPLCETAKPFCAILHKFLSAVDKARDYQIKIGPH